MPNDFNTKPFCNELKNPRVGLGLAIHRASGESELGERLEQLARDLADCSEGAVSVSERGESDVAAAPALSLFCDGRRVVSYLAFPEGPEAEPFVEIIAGLARGESALSDKAAIDLTSPASPTDIKVFIASACPHCPQAVRAAGRLAIAGPNTTLSVIDAQIFPELARRYSARSVPMTVVDDGLSIVGVVSEKELVDRLSARGTTGYEIEVFESMIETGRHKDAAKKLSHGAQAERFLTMWRKSSTSERIGLLLVVEEALDQDRCAIDFMVPDLTPLLSSDDAPMRGDTADLLGQIGHPDALGPLEELESDPNSDVAEIAAEAIDSIKNRSQNDG